ncbi:MAG: response regulator [Verrucomicrobiota bacterium]
MKILVVDDSSTIRRRIRKELEGAGHEVFDAADGMDAIGKLSEVNPDIMTLDVDMPGIDGYETCRRIRKGEGSGDRLEFSDMPIVFITANDTERSRQACYSAGGSEYLSKPFLQGELSLAVDRASSMYDSIRGHTVLIVDDSRAIRSYLTLGLRAKGLKVIEATNGQEALDFLRDYSKEVDVVVMDYVMPKMSGDELCAKIRQDMGLRDLPIIAQSSSKDKASILKMFRAGASDFLVKPFSIEEIQARVTVHVNSKNLGDSLRSTVTELKRAHKMKDQFLSICSHDLRAPLNGILGFAELMLMDEELSSENKGYLGHIKASSEFLFSIISDLLDLGRIESESSALEFEALNVVETINGCLGNLKHMASPKQIKLIVDNRCEEALIDGDSNAVKRIFNNLISNSIKFSHAGSEVRAVIEEEGDHLSISIVDTGIGIPKEKIGGLFDPSVKTNQLGTSGEQSFGLGMVIVKKLIDQHNALVSVESEQGVGTTVKVRFPIRTATVNVV